MLRSLSVVIPAYNEASRLPATLEKVTRYLAGSRMEFTEVLVVDDGSTDGTAGQAEAFAATHPNVRVLRNPGNRGKGYAVRSGMLEARGDWRLFTDADLSSPIEELQSLWEAVESKQADVAIGSRALNRALIFAHQPAYREAAGKFFNFVMQAAVGLPFQDTQCGFKLFSRQAAEVAFRRQRLERFGFDVEVLLIARLHGFRIEEVPVKWGHVEGTKVSAWNGAQSFLDLLAVRLNRFAGKYR